MALSLSINVNADNQTNAGEVCLCLPWVVSKLVNVICCKRAWCCQQDRQGSPDEKVSAVRVRACARVCMCVLCVCVCVLCVVCCVLCVVRDVHVKSHHAL